MKIDVLNIEGGSTGRSIDLSDDIFGIEPNEHALYLAVKQYNAHQRQGTHKSKERAEIAGSTRKIKKQKGTGTARAGSIKSPIFRGGGRIFGPRPRKYTIKLNKKVKRLARASALAQKLSQGSLKVVEDFTLEAPKTSQLQEIVNTLGVNQKKNILVTGEYDKNIYLSGRNMHKSSVMNAVDLNTFSILNCHNLILTEGAVEKISSSLTTETK
ncbi:MAG: large subunit ribosomal protein L4 [Saprospiraceae bacterium]|jgi:large subunit ribosomal protein L4